MNIFSLDDMFDSLLLMLSGMFLIMFGGWLLLLCTYKGVLLGFMNGLCTPVLKSIVMSRKSIIFLFASIVMLSLFSLKILHISFLIFSVSLAVLLHVTMYIRLQKGMSTHAICPVEWGEISTKQSVGKCKQINF